VTIAALTLDGDPATQVAGARSALYGLLAGAFAYPDDAFCESLASGAWHDSLGSAADCLPYSSPPSIFPLSLAAEVQEAYVTLFDVGTGKPFCPLYEGSHRHGRVKLMEELVRFYEHFGLQSLSGDHPDHICAELEFMHYLAFKEAASLSHGEEQPGLQAAQSDFLARHLTRWLPRVRARIESREGVPEFYRWASRYSADFCAADLQWLGQK
jgi:DMSO reductase family type II enzyme chaperone